jgi:hypothetical protein
MSMAMKHDDLKKLSDDDLKKKYDEVAGKTIVGLNFFLEEIMQRKHRKFERLNISLSACSLIIAIGAIVVTFIKR